jgi:nucleoside-diphosphate-sugar epimerase
VLRKDFRQEADELIWGSVVDPMIARQAVAGVDAVVHAAWTFNSSASRRPTFNEMGTELLLKESVDAGVAAFAFISSVAVYGMMGRDDSTVKESSPLATGGELLYLYPSEKITCENMLLTSDRRVSHLGIFRPGPIFDDEKGPMKKLLTIAGHSFALGIGNGRNRMGYIHAEDVAAAVLKWLKTGQNSGVFNVTPSAHLVHRDWYRVWADFHNLSVRPVFIRGFLVKLANLGIKVLKRLAGKKGKGDINYTIKASIRDMEYNNEALKRSLYWNDEATTRYTALSKMIQNKF